MKAEKGETHPEDYLKIKITLHAEGVFFGELNRWGKNGWVCIGHYDLGTTPDLARRNAEEVMTKHIAAAAYGTTYLTQDDITPTEGAS